MNFLNNQKIGTKLSIGFGVFIVFLLTVAVGSAVSMARMHDVVKAMDADAIVGLSSIDDVMDADNCMRVLQADYLILGPSSYASIDKKIVELRNTAEAGMAVYDKTIAHDDDRKNFEKYKEVWKNYLNLSEQFRARLGKGSKASSASFYENELNKAFEPLQSQASLITEYNKKIAKDYISESDGAFANAIKVLVILVSTTIALMVIFGFSLTRRIVTPVKALSERMDSLEANCITDIERGIESLANGDLTFQVNPVTKPLEVSSMDETGKMSETFNRLLEKIQRTIGSYNTARQSLTQLVGELKKASSQVSGASLSLTSASQQVESAALEVGASMKEISSASTQAARGAAEVASGSTSQAQALSQSSHNIQKLVDAIQSVAQDAELASAAASSAGNAASEGTSVVEDSMRGMKAIENTVSQSATVIQTLGESSHKIGTIVQTINEIAEQTNLLALNAAIEAARAGEAGRGFAVVADEVRKLAERSGGATREIGALISEIQSHTTRAVAAMEAGTREVKSQNDVAESTQAAFNKIQDVFKSVVDRVEDIRRSTQDMARASQEVARSITEVAAVVEESSAAAEELSASAEQVSASVDTVAGAAQQQSAAVSDLVMSSDQLQTLSVALGDIVSSFRTESSGDSSAPHLHLRRAA